MPELPEVEVVKKSLEDKLKNLTIKRVFIANNKLRYKINNRQFKEIEGKKINALIKEGKISKEKLDEIVDRTKKGGAEIVKYLEKGSAFYAPAASGVEMAESYLKDLKKQLPCAVYLNGEYGARDIYAGVPVIIGAEGVEKVIEIDLSIEEKDNFDKSVKAVRDLFEAARKIDSSLS